jgi:hypothetical protein
MFESSGGGGVAVLLGLNIYSNCEFVRGARTAAAIAACWCCYCCMLLPKTAALNQTTAGMPLADTVCLCAAFTAVLAHDVIRACDSASELPAVMLTG